MWYAMAGTHGCDQDACDRFDRDFRIYVASLAALTIGLVFASGVGLTVLTRRLRTVRGPLAEGSVRRFDQRRMRRGRAAGDCSRRAPITPTAARHTTGLATKQSSHPRSFSYRLEHKGIAPGAARPAGRRRRRRRRRVPRSARAEASTAAAPDAQKHKRGECPVASDLG